MIVILEDSKRLGYTCKAQKMKTRNWSKDEKQKETVRQKISSKHQKPQGAKDEVRT